MISLRSIGVSIEQKKILGDVSFDSVPDGVVAVMGPSGCGKSTLLKALMGIHRFQQGEIGINGHFTAARLWSDTQSVFTLVPQIPLLLPWQTLLDNVALAADPRILQAQARAKASQLLKIVGLSDAESLYPWQVSQGMAARASLARTLMIDGQVLLLDEPFAAIDATTRFRLQKWLLETIAQLGIQALLVTHDPREALLIADKVMVLGHRPAGVIETISLPSRNKRKEPDWIFGPEAGQLEKQIRAALVPDAEKLVSW